MPLGLLAAPRVPRPLPGRTAAYRPDIDGLRAIAITSVVLFHASSRLVPSGFVGVDIFFVISGFLIGGIVDRDTRAGRFGFMAFYARRARRILPALMALLLAVCAAGCVLFSARELWELGVEAFGALFGVANLKFWLKNWYFDDSAPTLPLLMTWSLGVEEQFYVVFPALMLAIARLAQRARFAVVAGLTLASFAISAVLTPHDALAAFYLLPARAWELGAGVLLAMAAARRTAPAPGWLTQAAGLAGLALTAASLFAFDRSTVFPGVAALLPVAGAVLLLHAEGSLVNRRLLASPPFVGVGLVSYSWYLWHWPLMSLAHDVCDTAPPATLLFGAAAAALVIATASWRWIERPFRRSGLSPARTVRRYALAVAGFALLPLALIATRGLPGRLPGPVQVASLLRDQGSGDCQLTFGVSALPEGSACMPSAGPARIIALLGDSHANALGVGLADYAAQHGHRLWQVEKSACMPLAGVATAYEGRPGHLAECAAFLHAAIGRIASEPAIDTVVIAGAWPADDDPRMADAQDGARLAARAAVRAGLPPLVDRFQQAGKHVVVMGDVPHFGQFNPMRHALTEGMPARRRLGRLLDPRRHDGDRLPLDRLDPRFDDVRAYVRQLASDRQAAYLDIADQLCDGRGCQFQADGVPLFVDDTHLSSAGSRRVDWTPAAIPEP